MAYFPVLLDLSDRTCTIVGGGRVAARKAASLSRAGARVRVVAPHVGPALKRMAAAGRVELVRRRYRRGDLANCVLAVAATDDAKLNRSVRAEALRRQLPCNAADEPGAGSILFPSIIRRGGLIVAISTEGASPALARRLKRDLESRIGPEYAAFAKLLREVRRRLKRGAASATARRRALQQLANSAALDRLRQGQPAQARAIAEQILDRAQHAALEKSALRRS